MGWFSSKGSSYDPYDPRSIERGTARERGLLRSARAQEKYDNAAAKSYLKSHGGKGGKSGGKGRGK